jgi:hypothetical protein
MEGIRMAKIKTCKQCGVPRLVSKGQTWHDNGVVTETKDPEHRMFLCESDYLEDLFQGIEDTIGIPIEKFVIEIKRRLTKEYLEKMIPAFARRFIFIFKPDLVARRSASIAKVYGYGDAELVELHKTGMTPDHMVMTIEKPYSILFFCGDTIGGCEASFGRACTVETQSIGDDKYQLDVYVGSHPPELQERLKPRRYDYKPGNLKLERCTSCGIPLDVAAYHWDLDAGTITTPEKGRRMALFGPYGLEAVFDDLEAELGESIPNTIIEVQRRYVRKNLWADWLKSPEDFRRMCALRGLGNLIDFETDEKHISLTIQNPCIVYVMVGIVQGLFEIATGRENTTHSWSRTETGDLTITVTAG